MNILSLLLIFWLGANTGVLSEPSPVDQYSLKGASICLNVTEPPAPLTGVKWSVNKDFIVVDNKVSPSYKEKVDYMHINHSLCIKNLVDTDSGTYTVIANKDIWKVSTASYRLTVQEALPRPVMKTSLFHYNSSVGLCIITVNCSVQNDWTFSSCAGGQCTRIEQSLSLNGISITVSNDNGTIRCTGSNHVSTKTSLLYEDKCVGEKDSEASAPSMDIIVVTLGCVGLVLFLLVCVIICHKKQQIYAMDDPPQVDTVYSDVQRTAAAAALNHSMGTVNTSPGDPVYSTVNQPLPAAAAAAATAAEHYPVDRVSGLPKKGAAPQCPPQVDTVYCATASPTASPRGKCRHFTRGEGGSTVTVTVTASDRYNLQHFAETSSTRVPPCEQRH